MKKYEPKPGYKLINVTGESYQLEVKKNVDSEKALKRHLERRNTMLDYGSKRAKHANDVKRQTVKPTKLRKEFKKKDHNMLID